MLKRLGGILACLCMTLLFGSCIFDYPSEIEDGGGSLTDKNRVVLQINVKSLTASDSERPTEKIKSLRVVIVGRGEGETPDSIECNRLLDIPDVKAEGYSYIVMWSSKPGEKDIYVLGNEESMGDGLTDILDGYAEKTEAGDFATAIGEYTFSPEYTPDASGNIYLPYSYSYEGIQPKTGVVNTINAWLVPVATKFIFNFVNNRTYPVKVNGISMSYANRLSYLLARPGEDEIFKEYNKQQLYWVDWLAEISKNSWNYPGYAGNEEYNGTVGWISDYSVPDPDDREVFYFVKEDSADIFEVPGATELEGDGADTGESDGNEHVAGKYSTPVYYLPESVNYTPLGADLTGQNADQDSGNGSGLLDEQRFYLTILLEDTGGSTAPIFEDIAIPNLKALFRNTYVIINMTMSEGDIEVYAEIAPWNRKKANGWLNEGQAPSNNPFRIRKKW